MLLLRWLLCLLLIQRARVVQCVVNITTNNEAWYCNTNPLDLHPISALSEYDLTRIHKLKQVHVMTRHGARTHQHDFQTYFPNSTQYYQCDISTIQSRLQYNTDDNRNQYFVSMNTLYEDDNQYLLHSNCQRMQSYSTLIQQHQQNAQILINAYMSNNNASHLFNIYELNAQSETQQYIKSYTSDRERCMLSTMVLISSLLNISSSNQSYITPTIQTITNDQEFNPYSSPSTPMCTDNQQWKDWNASYTDDITDNYIKEKRQQILDKYSDALDAYTDAGGLIDSTNFRYQHPGFPLTFFYCNGFDIPLKNTTFWTLVESAYEYMSAIHPQTSGNEKERGYADKKQCYNHFMAIPVYKRFIDDLHSLMDDDLDYKRFILHSAHDSTIAQFLTGLGLHDGVTPYFAQMFSLEIYSANQDNNEYNKQHNITYLFRFTNKGNFVPYEPCGDEYAANNGSQLCDVNILLNNGFQNVNITQRYWAQNMCKTVLDDCVCGYCNNESNRKPRHKWELESISLILGIICGVALVVFTQLMVCCFKRKLKTSGNYQRADDLSDIEIEMEHNEHHNITK